MTLKQMKLIAIHARSIGIFVFVLFLQSCAPVLTPEETQVKRATWRSQKVAPGVQWSYHHFESLFDARQSVTVFEMDPGHVTTLVEHLDSGFFLTSTRAGQAGAITAVNGSFFDTKRGGSVVFFQKNGVVITPSRDSPRAYRDNAGFAIDPSGKVSLWKCALVPQNNRSLIY